MYRGSLPAKARKDYINAVKCFTHKPAKSSKRDVPGARSRFDDWAAVHIKLTNNIHFDVRLNFLLDPSARAPFGHCPHQSPFDRDKS